MKNFVSTHKKLVITLGVITLFLCITVGAISWYISKSINDFYFPDDFERGIITVTKDISQCDEPWDRWQGSSKYTNKTNKIESYLNNEMHIDIESIEFKTNLENGMAVCEACNCPSGQTLTIKTDKKYLSKLEAIGFKQN